MESNFFYKTHHKKYYSIGEVSEICGLEQHVLRYWETQFDNLNPEKRRGKRRYYQQKDIDIINRIKELLYSENYTLQGAKALIEQSETSETVNDRSAQLSHIVARLQNLSNKLSNF